MNTSAIYEQAPTGTRQIYPMMYGPHCMDMTASQIPLAYPAQATPNNGKHATKDLNVFSWRHVPKNGNITLLCLWVGVFTKSQIRYDLDK